MIGYRVATAADFELLLALRIEAMRESLTHLGRFDPDRARERFLASFSPEHTRHILLAGMTVGFVAVKPQGGGLLLDHLYLLPAVQGAGTGSTVLSDVLSDADARASWVDVVALRASRANQFYRRHGFLQRHETEWDVHYRRPAAVR